MTHINRRTFLQQSAAASLPLFVRSSEAQRRPNFPLIRHNALSTPGQAMLAKYAHAVQIMKSKPASDPCSWTFWWYIHAIPPGGPSSKAQAIQQVFGSASSPARTLAQQSWYTCQPHSQGQNTDNFLPWHRMYVYFFEKVIRAVLNDPLFTLPYWNYSPGLPGSQSGVMPQAFRSPANPSLAPLYVSNRNAGVNSGSPIDTGNNGALSALSAMAESTYSPNSPKQGFCNNLDFGLHGNVHGLVGTGTNMGFVPTAAQDPIFWMHHCNIDRLWASWNKLGHTNPTDTNFLNQSFWFPGPDCQGVQSKVADVMSIAALKYSYDQFQPGVKPVPRPVERHSMREGAPVHTTTVASSRGVSLSAASTRVTLAAPPGAVRAKLFDPALAAPAPDLGRYYLVIRNLQVKLQPGVLYTLYLNVPENASAEARAAHRVGTLNFFSAMPGMPMDEPNRFISYDITDLARRFGAAATETANLTVIASGEPAGGSEPVIGLISIERVD